MYRVAVHEFVAFHFKRSSFLRSKSSQISDELGFIDTTNRYLDNLPLQSFDEDGSDAGQAGTDEIAIM
jgi:hypothetical protein